MEKKSTNELTDILMKTHPDSFSEFMRNNKKNMTSEEDNFFTYIKNKIQEKGLTQHRVFIHADISEKYGYKILSGEKTTRRRDVILRICYAAELTLQETQHALKKYEMPELYPKTPRDALLMTIFNTRPGDILMINTILTENGFEPLRTSGVQD